MKSKAEQWIEAYKWGNGIQSIPACVSREIQKRYNSAIKKATPFKPRVRFNGRAKPKTISQLKKELDTEFSVFIRIRDCQYNVEDKEKACGNCVTCDHFALWRAMDCGHYVPRQDLATRWDEMNCHLQCKFCNGFRGGEQEKMAVYIDAKYGNGTSKLLREFGKKPFKLNRSWLEEKIKHYKTINEGE